MKKQLKQFLRELKEQGYEISHSNGGHHKIRSPKGEIFFTSSTPSCPRGLLNIKAEIKRGRPKKHG